MASAVREAIRTPARMEPEKVCDQHLEAGDRTVSPTFRYLRRAETARGAADWLSGFEAGFRDNSYPANVQDCLAWSAGFIEGAAQRLQRLASMRITPRFALLLWWRP